MNEQNEENRIMSVDLRIFLYDFLQIARRTVVLLLAAVLLCSGLLCWRMKRSYQPLYQASATFTVYVANPLQSEIRGYNTTTAEQMAKTFPYILTSGALSSLVMQKLDIPAMPSVSASVMENTNIFTLRVTSGDPQLAYDVLEQVIAYYPEVAEFVVGPTIMNLLDESGVPTQPYNAVSYTGQIKRGALCGAVIWAALCLLQTMLRSTVHNEEELKRILNLRCIGVFPKVRGQRRNPTCPIFGRAENDSGFEESVRLARIRAEKEMRDKRVQVLMISSAISGEGKTTVSLNLAAAFAEKGKRTLLIDCDLRNPSVARYLGQENTTGVTELLKGTADAKSVIRETGIDNLYVIYAGGPTGEAAELLATSDAGRFVEEWRTCFDLILLDTPPVSILADASELTAIADGALLTVRQNYAAKREIVEGVQILSDNGLPLIGCVMNYASGGLLSSYGGYYGYGKYYSHDKSAAERER